MATDVNKWLNPPINNRHTILEPMKSSNQQPPHFPGTGSFAYRFIQVVKSTNHQSPHSLGTHSLANVAAVWGTELIQSIAALALLLQDDLKEGTNSFYSILHIVLVHFILFF